MFTGIVQDLVSIVSVENESNLIRIAVDLGELTENLELGASVAVNGTCLTVTSVDQGAAYFDVIKETAVTTNLADLKAGQSVNVERSFKVGDEVGGHIISGHVTATAALVDLKIDDHDRVLSFKIDPKWMNYILHKGYVGLDGASLTVSSVDRAESLFSVSLIPETIERTTLGRLELGDKINVEVDSQTLAIVETVERVLADPLMREQFLSSQGLS